MKNILIQHNFDGCATYLSDQSYLAIKEEVTAGTAVIPNFSIPLVKEDVKTILNHKADDRMKGINWKSNDLIRGFRTHEGSITVLADPDTLGYFLNMGMTLGSETGTADGYTHPFTVGAGKTYTIEIKKGLYCQRYVGVTLDELTLDFSDGNLQITAKIMAMGQFSVSTLGVALTGAGMTAATFDDNYDINPTYGLVVADIVNINGTDVTIATVTATGITFSSTSVTASIGDTIYLKPQTVSLATLQDPFYFGNVFAGFGVDATAAATAASARSTATPIYDLKVTIKKNLFAQNGSNRFDPVQIIPRANEAQVELKRLFETAAQRQKFMERTKQALVLVFNGKFIKADFTTQEKCTITFNNIKLLDNPNAISVGELIVDDQSFEVLYDNTNAAAMSVSLINRTAAY